MLVREPIVGDTARRSSGGRRGSRTVERLTVTGTTILRFRDDGLIVDHRDWSVVAGREEPYDGW